MRLIHQMMMCALAAFPPFSGGAVLVYGTTGFLYFELPGNPDLTWQDALWYCLVTLTTVGYGDFAPVDPLIRGFSNIEAIVGQLYPATLLARLVSSEVRVSRSISGRNG